MQNSINWCHVHDCTWFDPCITCTSSIHIFVFVFHHRYNSNTTSTLSWNPYHQIGCRLWRGKTSEDDQNHECTLQRKTKPRAMPHVTTRNHRLTAFMWQLGLVFFILCYRIHGNSLHVWWHMGRCHCCHYPWFIGGIVVHCIHQDTCLWPHIWSLVMHHCGSCGTIASRVRLFYYSGVVTHFDIATRLWHDNGSGK